MCSRFLGEHTGGDFVNCWEEARGRADAANCDLEELEWTMKLKASGIFDPPDLLTASEKPRKERDRKE